MTWYAKRKSVVGELDDDHILLRYVGQGPAIYVGAKTHQQYYFDAQLRSALVDLDDADQLLSTELFRVLREPPSRETALHVVELEMENSTLHSKLVSAEQEIMRLQARNQAQAETILGFVLDADLRQDIDPPADFDDYLFSQN
jgi:hypothetical protein